MIRTKMTTRHRVTMPLNCTMVAAARAGSASSGVMKNCLSALVAPLITAVSYPNNNPPSVATSVSAIITGGIPRSPDRRLIGGYRIY